jgi:hypothetical protein
MGAVDKFGVTCAIKGLSELDPPGHSLLNGPCNSSLQFEPQLFSISTALSGFKDGQQNSTAYKWWLA